MTSKKLIKVFDHSAVTFIAGCTLLILSINYFNLSSPCCHMRNTSSMYLHHKYGFYSDSFIVSPSSSAISKMLLGGAILVPIEVSRFCLYDSFPNVKILFLILLRLNLQWCQLRHIFPFDFRVVFLM